MNVTIYTDGSTVVKNPGPSGWAAILLCKGKSLEISGSIRHATNNQTEILAAIEGLKRLKRACNVTIVTDSNYMIGAMNGNKRNKNENLLRELDTLVSKHEVQWQWVKGHTGDPNNELVNTLAQVAAAKANIETAKELSKGVDNEQTSLELSI